MGRPLLSPTERRRNSVQIYLDDHQFRVICRVAIKNGKQISTYLREIALKECETKEATK